MLLLRTTVLPALPHFTNAEVIPYVQAASLSVVLMNLYRFSVTWLNNI